MLGQGKLRKGHSSTRFPLKNIFQMIIFFAKSTTFQICPTSVSAWNPVTAIVDGSP